MLLFLFSKIISNNIIFSKILKCFPIIFRTFASHKHYRYGKWRQKSQSDQSDISREKLQNKWLAEQPGRDQATVSKWVTYSSQPSLNMLIKIAKVLEVDIRFD